MYSQGHQKQKIEGKIGEEHDAAKTSPFFIDEACCQWVLQEIGVIRLHLKYAGQIKGIWRICAFIVQVLHIKCYNSDTSSSNCNSKNYDDNNSCKSTHDNDNYNNYNN